MSSKCVPIPQRKRDPAETSSYSSSASSSSSSPMSSSSLSRPSSSSKGKAAAVSSSSSTPVETISPRRPSLLGSSLAKSESTTVNLGHSDGPPRLVTCLKSSQGFDWNQELFLPSYANPNHEAHELEHKQDPVEDIILTDEEADAMLPQ